MDDELFPPSAFTKSSSHGHNFQEDKDTKFSSEFYAKPSKKVIESNQISFIKTANKGTLTSEKILSTDDFELKIKSKKEKYLIKTNIMKQQFQEELLKISNETADTNKKLFEVIHEKKSLAEELSKIKFYISGMENRDAWLEEKQRLLGEIDRLQYSISDQHSIIESLKVQLSSIEKIQWIQEQELDKDIINNSQNKLPKSQCHYESLLHTWRHKVLSLLVQQESSNIVANNEKHIIQQERQGFKNEIEHLQSSLEQASLRLEVQHAQLSTSEILIEKYKRENHSLHHQLEMMIRDQQEKKGQIDIICDQLNNFQRFVEEEFTAKFNDASLKIDSFHRRLDYASSRFPMIQANLKRHRNMYSDGRCDDPFDEEYLREVNFNKVHQLEEALIITNNEVKMLRQERDKLIATLEEDSATFHDRLNKRKDELKEDMDNLRSAVSKYEMSLPKMSKDLELMKQENYRLRADYDLLLSTNHSDMENLHQLLKESRTELSKMSLEYSEYKRSAIQRQKHMEEEILSSEQKIILCDNNWKKICDQLSAERDILKMTIRQDGLLSKLKHRNQEKKCTTDSSLQKKVLDAEIIMREVNVLAEELHIDLDR